MDYKLDLDYKLGMHQSLKEQSDIWDFEKEELDPEELEHDMCNFMLNHNGIGLAANQLNIRKRVFTIGSQNVPGFPEPFAVFNPVILESSEDKVLQKEGCLSFPGLWFHLKRPKSIIAQYQNSKGVTKEAKIEGYLATCFQHELDHLNGICFVDKVGRLKLQLAMTKLKKRLKKQ